MFLGWKTGKSINLECLTQTLGLNFDKLRTKTSTESRTGCKNYYPDITMWRGEDVTLVQYTESKKRSQIKVRRLWLFSAVNIDTKFHYLDLSFKRMYSIGTLLPSVGKWEKQIQVLSHTFVTAFCPM